MSADLTVPSDSLEYIQLQYALAKAVGDFKGMVQWARAEQWALAAQFREAIDVR